MLVVLIIVGIVLVDQVTKLAVISRFGLGDYVSVIPGFFDIRYVRNTGAAWGMLSGYGIFLVLLSVVMLILIYRYRRQFLYDTVLHRCAGGLMTAGIIGNLIDRIKWGYVIDFLDFYAGSSHFPAFNVADSAICTGVTLYMLSQVLDMKKERRERLRAAGTGS